ncbi:hypothetical protein [Nonomuraea cavernae]|uniref:DUF3800 domain-containing protein n=1 Tax=Nonomuraea cavernae TaxID=2045107 RepID=A0A917YXA4_9ACTN|nr:hypothetical protein [Nonomuraea cavernae]MCA2187405.1 hypothetical protein [Nonomuraea cavernae]GGO68523.1 hypothetical protein GCM10012289_27490 [Nonomuraea cavernae]
MTGHREDSTHAGGVLEIACDESGSEGDKLIGGNTDVFAHASVRLSADLAARCIEETRDRAPSPTTEYKFSILRRTKHREALIWLLGPRGPLLGHAHVHLTDKTFFVVGRVVDLLVTEAPYPPAIGLRQDRRARSMTATLRREGPRAYGAERWESFLAAFNGLMRSPNHRSAPASVAAFFDLVDDLRRSGARSPAGEAMELLWLARPRVAAFRERLLADPGVIPALDTLIPAIVGAVAYWGAGGRSVAVVHDRQTLLTDERIGRLKELLHAREPGGRLTGLTLVDSRCDPRIQVADLLAGAARKIASDELNGRGDAELTALLRPYVDTSSIWSDDRHSR